MIEDEDKQIADDASYEDELTSKRTVTIPLREYDELKLEQHFIKDKALIDIIDNIERLVRALRKHIVRTDVE
jgi:hypothetical protein